MASSSAAEHFIDIEVATGSNPVPPTMEEKIKHCPKCDSTNLLKQDSGTVINWKCLDCKFISRDPVEKDN